MTIQTAKAQDFDLKKYRLIYQFKTIKKADNSRKLTATYYARNKKNRKDRIPIYQGEIVFVNIDNDREIVLGKTHTNEKGIASLIVPSDHQYTTDNEGYINLEARFYKTNFLPRKTAKQRFKDIQLSLNLETIDSLNTVVLKAFTLDSLGVASPVNNLNINIAVKGMLSNLILDEATIENGNYNFEFPSDIPGDLDGNIIVYSIIDDHDDFGDVVQEATAVWGMVRPAEKENNHMLWSSAAPYWMYVVLTILLVGVWANYAYTIYNLFKLKKEGNLLVYN